MTQEIPQVVLLVQQSLVYVHLRVELGPTTKLAKQEAVVPTKQCSNNKASNKCHIFDSQKSAVSRHETMEWGAAVPYELTSTTRTTVIRSTKNARHCRDQTQILILF